ncbi:hypothetical protein ACS47_13350 [Bacillus cereus]|nr:MULTISPECIES: hypothetical protein [Bacillus cereus group]ANT40215.1 hypothetical protein [Bacillus phage PfNC7401]ANT40365.1 hypothetical protein [Bacillus phage PfIS075]EJP82532.1 hypothetical protein IAU_05748 [Bacillus cereus IS075]EJR02004.1 hypothetical protein II7_05807 [Bacillus cereus MSX-A12]EOO82152.1 hypothetical protein IGS_05915 [Bacillus cereus IS845/00]EOO95272.1 hypothetical protein IGQ_04031 [Bacillus cereus IS195]KXI76950.1 hypothetical protein ACS54_21565 [Bacillus cer
MKYFEFNKHEYWALVVAENVIKACEVYAEEVAGESVVEVQKEGAVDEITKEIAFGKYLSTVAQLEENKTLNLQDYLNDFNGHENTTLLITSELA